jgi:YNFM family putative membrane transporter
MVAMTEHAGYRPGSRELHRIEVALFAAGLATFALLYATQPLLPELADVHGVSAGSAALTVSLATLGLGLALLVAGPLSEVVGRTRLMHASLGASSLIGLLCALAPSWHVLLALRTVQGVALAGLPAVAVAYLREEVHDEAYGRVTGLYIAGTALGGMLGRLVSGGLANLGGWRLALAGIGGLGLACATTTLLLLPASRRFVPTPPKVRVLLSTTRGVLGDPVLLGLYALGATLMGAFVAVYNAMSFRLVGPPYDLSVAVAGLVFCVYPLGSVASVVTGRLADRHGRRTVAPLVCTLMLAGVLLTLTEPLPLVVLGLAVMTTGFFATHGLASGWVGARAHHGVGGTGQASSLYLVAYYAGSSVFGGLAGTVWAHAGWGGVVVLAGSLTALALALTLALRRTTSLLPAATDPELRWG